MLDTVLSGFRELLICGVGAVFLLIAVFGSMLVTEERRHRRAGRVPDAREVADALDRRVRNLEQSFQAQQSRIVRLESTGRGYAGRSSTVQ